MENFYIAVTKNGRPDATPGNLGLVLGPFGTRAEAEDRFDETKRYIAQNYCMEGSHWWGYSIVGIAGCDRPGRLNRILLEGVSPK